MAVSLDLLSPVLVGTETFVEPARRVELFGVGAPELD
jgi:hypothetical protein